MVQLGAGATAKWAWFSSNHGSSPCVEEPEILTYAQLAKSDQTPLFRDKNLGFLTNKPFSADPRNNSPYHISCPTVNGPGTICGGFGDALLCGLQIHHPAQQRAHAAASPDVGLSVATAYEDPQDHSRRC